MAKEESEKRTTVIREDGSTIFADCLNRQIGDKENPVKLSKLTLQFNNAANCPRYIFDAAVKLTLIRVQDDARRTMTAEEIAALDGTTIDAQDFWAQRQDRKARAVKPLTVNKAAAGIAKMADWEKAELLRKMLEANPELAALLK